MPKPALAVLLLAAAITATVARVPDPAAAAPAGGDGPLRLYLVPHTHADTGWLETLDTLARMNTSRILDGVVGHLKNDTRGTKRFVWDEVVFLQMWWHNHSTAEQRADFTRFVHQKKIEFVDGGMSQHDMGCTTFDSMFSNFMAGHQFIVNHFGEAARPRVGWSLDPFGISASNAIFYALAGFDAYFFTRLPFDTVADMKAQRTGEFVWRPSSTLPPATSEIFAHVLLDYYCMPQHFRFEHPGVPTPTNATDDPLTRSLANELVSIAFEQREWWRTDHVVIPWGCDYMYQNADLLYGSTDIVINAINANKSNGVTVQYATPSEYLAAVHATNTKFPVHTHSHGDFFPYITARNKQPETLWTGYYTSRSALKGRSTEAHALLHAAEALFALKTPRASGEGAAAENARLWAALEKARTDAGTVQHHDALTGTMCSAAEGCTGGGQTAGDHDVLADYMRMLDESMQLSGDVVSSVLGREQRIEARVDPTNGELSLDVARLGKLLMDGKPALVVVLNPLLGHDGNASRTEGLSIKVPVCAMTVQHAEGGAAAPAQVTAQLDIDDGSPYVYTLHVLIRHLPQLEYTLLLINPTADATCGGSDDRVAFVKHEILHDTRSCDDDDHSGGDEGEGERRRAEESPAQPAAIVLRNPLLSVTVDPKRGLQAVYNRLTGTNHSLKHELWQYSSNTFRPKGGKNGGSDSYCFRPDGPPQPVLGAGDTTVFATSAIGPVLQEVRLQITPYESKTVLRLWVSDDPAVGGRLEVQNHLGVLEQNTEIVSRFITDIDNRDSSGRPVMYSESNGYELERRVYNASRLPNATADLPGTLAVNYWPSQMSALIHTGGDFAAQQHQQQLSVALDRSHGVSTTPTRGVLEVMQHRRTINHGVSPAVVMDDASRVVTQIWLSIGEAVQTNRARHALKLRLNHPLVPVFTAAANSSVATSLGLSSIATPSREAVPAGVYLQSVRALDARGTSIVARVMSTYSSTELDPLYSVPSYHPEVEIPAALGLRRHSSLNCTEVALTAMATMEDVVAQRVRFPALGDDVEAQPPVQQGSSDECVLRVSPFEIRTVLVSTGDPA